MGIFYVVVSSFDATNRFGESRRNRKSISQVVSNACIRNHMGDPRCRLTFFLASPSTLDLSSTKGTMSCHLYLKRLASDLRCRLGGTRCKRNLFFQPAGRQSILVPQHKLHDGWEGPAAKETCSFSVPVASLSWYHSRGCRTVEYQENCHPYD